MTDAPSRYNQWCLDGTTPGVFTKPDPLPKHKLDWYDSGLEGFAFCWVDLTGSTFALSRLRGVFFEGCILNNVEFAYQTDRTSMQGEEDRTSMQGAELPGETVLGSTFECVDLQGADLKKLIAHSTTPGTFTRDHVCFDGADLRGADLKQANIRGASFQRSGKRPAWLVGTDLRGANASGANFTGAEMTSVYAIEANLEGANLTGAILVGARLERANLEGADLTGAILVYAWLDGCNLRGANLTNADLRMASLEGADLTGAILDGALLPADLVNLASREPEPGPATTEPGLLEAEPY